MIIGLSWIAIFEFALQFRSCRGTVPLGDLVTEGQALSPDFVQG
jgi:hypothetical protein